jgi:hypothetical protein
MAYYRGLFDYKAKRINHLENLLKYSYEVNFDNDYKNVLKEV